jgi:putative phosphoribosyl transferase
VNGELQDLLATGPLFRDRPDAGRVLAAELQPYRGTDALVVGLPRGGVVVAAEVARWLEAELDVIVARKLGSPFSPELAIGAVTADGVSFLNGSLIRALGIAESYIAAVTRVERAEAERREAVFRGERPRPRITGRTVILVDDGLATGATMCAAVRSVRREAPARLIVAVPVGSREACAALRDEADEVVCPYQPEEFGAVGMWYRHFEQTDDREVKELLHEFAAPARHA